jgi:hypothetical protein
MEKYCPVSCRKVDIPNKDDDDCQDALAKCSVWANSGECKINKEMQKHCPKSCNTCGGGTVEIDNVDDNNENQDDDDDDDWEEGKRDVEGIMDDEDNDSTCTDDHEKCSMWAVRVVQTYILRKFHAVVCVLGIHYNISPLSLYL